MVCLEAGEAVRGREATFSSKLKDCAVAEQQEMLELPARAIFSGCPSDIVVGVESFGSPDDRRVQSGTASQAFAP